jgi:hypothetical protein
MDLRPTDGHIVAGVVIDDHRFLGRMRASQLFQVAIDPRRTEDLRQLEGNTQLENVRRIRMEVQRLFEGAKAKNVEPYAQYIVNVHVGAHGMAPPIILFTEMERRSSPPALKPRTSKRKRRTTLCPSSSVTGERPNGLVKSFTTLTFSQ